MTGPVSHQVEELLKDLEPLLSFFSRSRWARREGRPGISDLVAGNPQEPALPEFVEALRRWSVPQDPSWFAYGGSVPSAVRAVAASLTRRTGLPFDRGDVTLTNGSIAAMAVALRAVVDPGDEVLFVSPPWFFYELLIRSAGAVPVRVRSHPPGWDLDVEAVAAAITERTRAIIVNSPNNPTGRIYPQATLDRLAATLTDASERNGRTVYLVSDEAYCRILFDGNEALSPIGVYPSSFLVYTYGKTLLTPGQRLGYLALPPTMPDRDRLREAIRVTQFMTGYAVPTRVLQHAVADLEELSIDLGALQRKRDRMVGALREMGYELHVPEATFYLLPRSPWPDDESFTAALAKRDVFVLPGHLVDLPGYFRISLTANEEMIERSLPIFAEAIRERR